MKNYLLLKYLATSLREYFLIFFTATILLFTFFTKSFSEENVFTINNVTVKGKIDLNFSREKYINKAFLNSFEILMNKILLSRDFTKINNIKLRQIKSLINSFQILEESYRKDEYKAKIKIFYSDIKVKKFLNQKNISFSQPENITAVFFPVFFINDEIQNFSENFFYKHWTEIEIKNELINFILPLEDLEDISKIMEMKNRIEELDVDVTVYSIYLSCVGHGIANHSKLHRGLHADGSGGCNIRCAKRFDRAVDCGSYVCLLFWNFSRRYATSRFSGFCCFSDCAK